MSITVVLNTYKRLPYLPKQIQACEANTIKPAAYLIWRNDDATVDLPPLPNNTTIGGGNGINHGVWARFAFALLAQTEFVCIFDDDTIPGCKWFEACYREIIQEDGLYGVNGAIFNDPENYYSYKLHGVARPKMDKVEVDIVGHCWFLRRNRLHRMFEMPPRQPFCGEDMAISLGIQKQGLKTWAMPHPPNDRDAWGSIEPKLNRDGNGIGAIKGLRDEFNYELKRLRQYGFQFLAD